MLGAYRPTEHIGIGSHPKQLMDPPEEFHPRQTTATRNRGLSFFVSEDRNICLGGKGQVGSRSRLSHSNKENIMDAANRPSGRMFI